MNVSIAERLADRLGRKMAQRTPFRSDFVVADFRVLDADRKTAKVLVQYDADLYGNPTKEEICSGLTHLYRDKNKDRPRLVVNPTTVKIYPKLQAVACTVQIPSLRRPFEDVKKYKMKEISAGTVFLGEDMNDTWAIAKAENGSVYIERLEADDIDQILKERSKSNSFRVHSNFNAQSSLTLARVERAFGNDSYSQGDKVLVNCNGKTRRGEILGMCEGGAQVRLNDGSQQMVSVAALQGVEIAAAAESINIEALKKFLKEAYGYSDEDLEKFVALQNNGK